MSPRYYALDDDNQLVEVPALSWAKSFESMADRRVALTRRGHVSVSTVFLGLNHQFGNGPPMVFETLVMGGRHDGRMERYSTWDDALLGHRRACLMVFPPTPATPSRNRREGRYLARLAKRVSA
jgi:hypothetical protein